MDQDDKQEEEVAEKTFPTSHKIIWWASLINYSLDLSINSRLEKLSEAMHAKRWLRTRLQILVCQSRRIDSDSTAFPVSTVLVVIYLINFQQSLS